MSGEERDKVGVGEGSVSAVRCVVTPIGLESGRDVSVCLSQIHKLFFHSLSLNGERERERESDVENDRICPAWNLWVSFSLSQAALSPTLSPSLFFSLCVSDAFSRFPQLVACAFYLRKYLR